MKLKKGDRVKATGFVMLKGVNDGATYEVFAVQEQFGRDVYQLRNVKTKTMCRHLSDSVDCWVKQATDEQLNKLVKV